MECILEKLRRDLTQASLEYAVKKHIDLDKDWLHQRITNKLGETKISFYHDPCKLSDVERCTARVWNGGKGTQCTHRRMGGSYCGKHRDMIARYNVLRFGDISEEKPSTDLIKQNGEKLSWIDPDPLNQLQKVVDQQSKKLIYATPHLVLS